MYLSNSLRTLAPVVASIALVASLSGCGGGGGAASDGGSSAADFSCDGSCPRQALTTEEVQQIIQQASTAARLQGVRATVALVDRVGNVLGVYQMSGAPSNTTITGQTGASGGLEALTVPATLSAISKAGTGAYLSSQGNAFSTRTASQIVQENFNPGERNQGGGPLFGVQFSQLLCSDVTVLDSAASGSLRHGSALALGGSTGPRPLPLGLSADPGGFPLYKNGDLVGGIGVEFDGSYTIDRTVFDRDANREELIALSATRGFEAPSERIASQMSVGKFLRYADVTYEEAITLPAILDTFEPSSLIAVSLFTTGKLRAGATFGDVSSGVFEATRAGIPSGDLVLPSGASRYPARNGTSRSDSLQLTASEVSALLDSALLTAERARAAIRRPLDTPARVSIWIVDHTGAPLGFTRSKDAPVFGIDVALQKARAAALMSSPQAARMLTAAGLGSYVSRTKDLLGSAALSNGVAITNRAVGNMARPFFPDGINGSSPGPLSLPVPELAGGASSWSPFNTGMQLDLVFGKLATALGLAGARSAIPDSCGDRNIFGSLAANGIQIFPGAVPLYRGSTLIGAIGVSGDGIDQDDLVAFYGASPRGLSDAGHATVGDPRYGFNAPLEIRSDRVNLAINDLRLRYVNCPEAPFSRSNEQNVCADL